MKRATATIVKFTRVTPGPDGTVAFTVQASREGSLKFLTLAMRPEDVAEMTCEVRALACAMLAGRMQATCGAL